MSNSFDDVLINNNDSAYKQTLRFFTDEQKGDRPGPYIIRVAFQPAGGKQDTFFKKRLDKTQARPEGLVNIFADITKKFGEVYADEEALALGLAGKLRYVVYHDKGSGEAEAGTDGVLVSKMITPDFSAFAGQQEAVGTELLTTLVLTMTGALVATNAATNASLQASMAQNAELVQSHTQIATMRAIGTTAEGINGLTTIAGLLLVAAFWRPIKKNAQDIGKTIPGMMGLFQAQVDAAMSGIDREGKLADELVPWDDEEEDTAGPPLLTDSAVFDWEAGEWLDDEGEPVPVDDEGHDTWAHSSMFDHPVAGEAPAQAPRRTRRDRVQGAKKARADTFAAYDDTEELIAYAKRNPAFVDKLVRSIKDDDEFSSTLLTKFMTP